MKSRLVKIELSAIYVTAALLVLSLAGLVGNAVRAQAADPFPNLRVEQASYDFIGQEKTVYFTFDDGPSPNTEKVLDVLREQDVKATFFVSAQNEGEAYMPTLLERIVEEGHTLALHSYSHEYGRIYRSVDAFLEDINRLNDYLYEMVGVRPNIYRFPGGSATVNCAPEVMKGIIREMEDRGYLFYDWDVVSGDDTATVFDPEYLAERIISGVQGYDEAVVLLHDGGGPVTSADAVDIAIGRLREQGYRFDRLTEQVQPVHINTTRFRLDDPNARLSR